MIPEVRQAVYGQLKGLTIFLYLCERKKRYGENWRIKYTGKPRTKDGGVGKLWLPDVAQHDESEPDDRYMPDAPFPHLRNG